MRFLVTGSAGHLGEGLVRTLRARGREVIGVDLKASAFTNHVGSIVDESRVRAWLRGVDVVIHAATLHKPHLATHSARAFAETNVLGTLAILEAAHAAGVGAVVFSSTTSAFGAALSPAAGEPAAFVTETTRAIPKNMYGVTKVAAEDLCELFARTRGLPTLVLRVARFFPEQDDDPAARARFAPENLKLNELLHRRLDLADAVDAHLLAAEHAPEIGFGRYLLSATSPFSPEHAAALRGGAAEIVASLFPACADVYARRGWRLPQDIARVYVNRRAREELGWRPEVDFGRALDRLSRGEPWTSELAREVGAKGYHDRSFDDGPYPVTVGDAGPD